MNLVIVESPAKAKTISYYLGPDYQVAASYGHVRDLPKKELGIDLTKDFEPTYQIIPRAQRTIAYLKKALEGKKDIILATDLDREGEAIAWHVVKALGLDEVKSQKSKVKRIVFNEITKSAIQEAIKKPRDIDLKLVDAQQARRLLDRLVGYKLSPFLWKKMYKGLSAGRVQSVAVRLIVEREREITNFKPEEYWVIAAILKKDGNEFRAILIAKDSKKLEQQAIKNDKAAAEIVKDLEKAEYKTEKVSQEKINKYPFPPHTTSTLQQDAFYKLGFSAKQTMKLAQDLYEKGLITYMRTDSVNISGLAVGSIRKFIPEKYGPKYLPERPIFYKTKTRGAQEAHEAIRPTYIKKTPEEVKVETENHKKLYELIWKRTVASQTKPAEVEETLADIKAKKGAKSSAFYTFQAKGQKILFDGFMKIYNLDFKENILPALKQGDILDLVKLEKKQEFTKPPYRFTEAALVKALEEKGIGRPSTYAPIISTIQDRGYVKRGGRWLYPQKIGEEVNDLLVKHFPNVVDFDFTAKMEGEFDEIAAGKKGRVEVLKEFYGPFSENLSKKEKEVGKIEVVKEEMVDKKCPKCGSDMVVRVGKFGRFLACKGYPKCKHTESIKKDSSKQSTDNNENKKDSKKQIADNEKKDNSK